MTRHQPKTAVQTLQAVLLTATLAALMFLSYRTFIRTPDDSATAGQLKAQQPLALPRLRLSGRHGLVNASGSTVPWTAVTGFRLIEQVAHGREGEAAAFLDSLGATRGVRVLLMARWLFQLSPEEGVAALAQTLDLAQRHGRYLEVTIFADTKSFSLGDDDYRRIADEVGRLCATHPSCALVEIANEVWSLHQTQADALGELEFLRALRDRIRSHGDIPVSLGSTHADQDDSDRMQDGDYLTVHGSRDDGDNGWGWVRQGNDQRALADRVGKWVVNDEPRRDDFDCGRQLGMGIAARLFSLGDTFHYAGGLQAQVPTGAETQAFACRARGWAAVPDSWSGSPVDGRASASPLKSPLQPGVHAIVRGENGYVLVLGAAPPSPLDWNDGWKRELLLDEDGTQLYRVSR